MIASQDPRQGMQDPTSLSEEIDATREDVGDTLDALQEKLAPAQLLDQSLNYLTDKGYELACGVGRAAREHPVPFALAAAGVLWYMKRRGRDGIEIELDEDLESAVLEGSDEYGDSARGRIAGKARSAAYAMKERASGAASSLADTTAQATRAVGQTTRRAKGEFSRVLREQPFLVAAIGLAIGAAISALIPVSEREEELLGEKSEQLVRRVKQKAGEQIDKARQTARRAGEAARSAISESGNGSGSTQGSTSGPSMQPNP